MTFLGHFTFGSACDEIQWQPRILGLCPAVARDGFVWDWKGRGQLKASQHAVNIPAGILMSRINVLMSFPSRSLCCMLRREKVSRDPGSAWTATVDGE